MRIRIQRCLINSVPSVIVYTTDWSALELGIMLRFGEPTVDLGGTFYKNPCHEDSTDCGCPEDPTDACDGEECFSLPSQLKKIKSGFPVMMVFESDKFKDPEFCGQIWADEIARRIALEVKDMRYNGTMFVKEETYEV